MKSQPDGTHTLEVEVTNISKHGAWILSDQERAFHVL